jgi:hypothetical protein
MLLESIVMTGILVVLSVAVPYVMRLRQRNLKEVLYTLKLNNDNNQLPTESSEYMYGTVLYRRQYANTIETYNYTNGNPIVEMIFIVKSDDKNDEVFIRRYNVNLKWSDFNFIDIGNKMMETYDDIIDGTFESFISFYVELFKKSKIERTTISNIKRNYAILFDRNEWNKFDDYINDIKNAEVFDSEMQDILNVNRVEDISTNEMYTEHNGKLDSEQIRQQYENREGTFSNQLLCSNQLPISSSIVYCNQGVSGILSPQLFDIDTSQPQVKSQLTSEYDRVLNEAREIRKIAESVARKSILGEVESENLSPINEPTMPPRRKIRY